MPYAIETVNLNKRFPQPKSYREFLLHPFRRNDITALKNINIQVSKGDLFGLLGPNGAGKTTLVKILCTLILPTEGSAFVNGYDVAKHGYEVRRTIGYVISEERSFYWRLTGRQNLKFFAKLNNLPLRQIDQRINELVLLTGLENDIDKSFQDYSTGVKKRLAIARGMLTDPQILFLDEPTANLDPVSSKNIRKFIKNVIVGERQKSVIIATNNIQEAEELCNRITIISNGMVKFCGLLEEIRQILNEKNRYVLRLQGSLDYLQQKLESNGLNGKVVSLSAETSLSEVKNSSLCSLEMIAGNNEISEIVKKMLMSGVEIESCTPKKVSLDEIFANIIK